METEQLPTTIEIDLGSNIAILDLTTLFSNYRCIYGFGCKGTSSMSDEVQDPIEGNPDKSVGCCLTGPQFFGDGKDTPESIAEYANNLTDDQCENNWLVRTRGWVNTYGGRGKPRVKTHKNKCVFLNSGDFGRPGCSLYHHAMDNGIDPQDTRPTACFFQPMMADKVRKAKKETWRVGVRRSTDPTWFSKDGYWCTRDAAAFTGTEPAFRGLSKELRYAFYDDTEYATVMEALEQEWAVNGDRYRELYWNRPAEPMPEIADLGMPKMP